MSLESGFSFGGFEINYAKAIRELRQDFKDDWFQDPLRFKDCLDGEIIFKYFTENVTKNHGNYEPDNAEVFNVPKKGFLLRYSLESNVYDRIVYQALTSELIPFYDVLLSKNSFSHRYNFGGRDKKYIFKHHVEQYKSFEGLIKAESFGKVLLITDVFNYYENIQVNQLKACLEKKIPKITASTTEKIKIRRVIDLLTTYLRKWSFNGESGLPQSRDASSFLANILMDDVDKEMEQKGFKYFRYMDDIRIICNDEFHARSALKVLTVALRRIGLNLNSAKTKIGKLSDDKIKEHFINSDRKLEAIDSMWKSRSLETINKSIPYLHEYAKTCLVNGSTTDRGFRFAINKIGQALSCDDLSIPPGYFSDITDTIIKDLDLNPTATDTLVKYLSFADLSAQQIANVVTFMCNDDRAIYGWQNLQLWKLAVIKKIDKSELHNQANKIINAPNGEKLADLAGAALYLGRFADEATRIKLLKLFELYDSPWLQRHLLIAIHELRYDKGVNKISKYTKDSVKGTYTRVRENIKAYIEEPEPTKFKDLYDEVSIYD